MQTINSLTKAVNILRIVAAERGAGLPLVMKRLGLPKSTSHRLLANLERTGLVERITAGGDTVYVLGPLMNELASGFAQSQRLRQIARPIMETLRDACNETVLLHVFQGFARVVVDQVESHQQLRRTYMNLGVQVPIYGGASSKVFLASLTADELRRLWVTFPAAITQPGKPGAFQRFVKELEKIRREGHSITAAEITPGVASIAMAIKGANGRVVACLSVTGPGSRLSARELKGFRPHLAAAVREVADALAGHSDNGNIRYAPRRKSGVSSKYGQQL